MQNTKRYPLPTVWSLASALIIAALCVNGILAYQALRDLRADQEEVNRSLASLVAINSTYAALLNAELGQRGLRLTNDERYLELMQKSQQEVGEELTALASTLPANSASQNLFEDLQTAIDRELDQLQQTAQEVQAGSGVIPAPTRQALISADSGLGRVRQLASDLEEEQYQQLNLRREDAQRNRRNALLTLAAATAGSLLLVVLVYFIVKRSTATRERLTHDLQQANDDLESKVIERTAALSHYANELARSNRELQDFAFVASHDLQEPLRKIRAFGDRLQQKYAGELHEQAGDYINRMKSAAERMSRLINDLLAFSRVTTKGQPFEEVDLNVVVHDVLEDLEVAIEEAQAEVKVETLPTISADPTQMRQLFQNLIGNALKFRKSDTQPVVEVTCTKRTSIELNGKLIEEAGEIVVSDNGIGFDDQFVDRIFTPFQRLHGRDQYGGTGIGLAVCRRIAERHNGKISARGKPDEGSVFTVTLPLEHPETLEEMLTDESR